MAEKRKGLKAPAPKAPIASMYSQASSAYMEDCAARMQPTTVRNKFSRLRDFASFLAADIDLASVTVGLAQRHISACQKRSGNKAANRHIRDLKALWNWSVRMGLTIGNPWAQLAQYPEDEYIKYIPPPEDVAAILLASQPWERDYLSVILRTAARAGEVRKMRWEDVDLARGVVTLWTRKKRGGDRRARAVTMSAQLKELMRRMWEARDRHSPWVFPNPKTGEPYRAIERAMRDMMSTLCARAGVREFGLHSLRHYVSVRLRDSGKASKFDIQAILGHQRSDTTDIYLRGLAPDLKEAVSALDDPIPGMGSEICTPEVYPLPSH
jgi:integrase